MEVLQKLKFKKWGFLSNYRVGAGRPFWVIRVARGGARNSIEQHFFQGLDFSPHILGGSKHLSS